MELLEKILTKPTRIVPFKHCLALRNFYLFGVRNFIFLLIIFDLQDRDEQRRLEMKHRKEEDDLYNKFARQREEEERRIRDEIRVS